MASYIPISNILDFAVAFHPTTAYPLDSRTMFGSKAAAEAAAATAENAGSSNTVYYFGQTLTVFENDVATQYVIQGDKTLKEVGSAPAGDGKSIVFDETTKTLKLYGFDAAAEGQQLRIQNGKLQWFTPDTSTVEGLSATVAGHSSDIGDLKDRMGAAESDIDGVQTAITTLNGTGNGSVKKAVDDGINDFATKLSDDGVINTFKELIDYVAAHGTEAGEMAAGIAEHTAAIAALQTLVGDTAVAAQIVNAIQAALKVDGVDKYALAADLAAAVARIAAAEGELDALTAVLGGKVDKVDGSRLMTSAEGTKLSGIEAGAQVNKIESVSDEFTLDDAKKLSIGTVAQSKVAGLPEALASKVTAVDGKGLSTEDFTAAEKEKLAGVGSGAQANVVETVKAGGAVLPVTDKSVDIPGATASALGLVKGSAAENGVTVKADFTMEVHSLNVSKLVQGAEDTLILDGGGAE